MHNDTASSKPENPIYLSSAEQVEQECFAAEVYSQPSVQAVVERIARDEGRYPQSRSPAGHATWHQAVQNYVFAYVLRYANADAEFPTVLWDQNPPLRRNGVDIPDSRCMGPNPDNIYRRAALDPRHRYVMTGRRRMPMAADANISTMPHYTLEGTWQQDTLDATRIETNADGTFDITLSQDDARGNPNHLRLGPGTVRLTIRDTLLDWAHEWPLELHLRRVDQERAPPRDANRMAQRLADEIEPFVDNYLAWDDRVIFSRPLNELKPPESTPRGLARQLSSMGPFSIAEDEALVIELDRLGAGYLGFQLFDPWLLAMEYRDQIGSMNHHQAVQDGDGRLRLVVAQHDSGVHNWIAASAGEGAMIARWQGLPDGLRLPDHPAISVRRIPLSRVRASLPEDTLWLTPRQRQDQIAARRAAHDRRFTL